MTHHDEERLIRKVLEGNAEAFASLVERYSRPIFALVVRIVGQREEAEELTQDIFVKAYTKLSSFGGRSAFSTWLYRIATNETLNRLRRIRRENAISLDAVGEYLAGKVDEDPYFDGNALQRELHKAIQKLPEKQRLVFNMRYFDEMKYEDIAEITGTSVGALKASYHHAYTKIKEALEDKV